MMRHFRIFFFWEQARTNLGPLMASDYIVTQESAAPTHDETERAAIAADHCGMVRFATPAAQGFRMVVDALMRYSDEAGEVVAQRRLDAERALGLERQRQMAEAMRSGGFMPPGVGMSAPGTPNYYYPPPQLLPPPGRMQNGAEDLRSRFGSGDSSSYRAPDEVRM
jgi:hypothetical protein